MPEQKPAPTKHPDPARTPGQAEGERDDMNKASEEPGKTPGKAEGVRETPEEAHRQPDK